MPEIFKAIHSHHDGASSQHLCARHLASLLSRGWGPVLVCKPLNAECEVCTAEQGADETFGRIAREVSRAAR